LLKFKKWNVFLKEIGRSHQSKNDQVEGRVSKIDQVKGYVSKIDQLQCRSSSQIAFSNKTSSFDRFFIRAFLLDQLLVGRIEVFSKLRARIVREIHDVKALSHSPMKKLWWA